MTHDRKYVMHYCDPLHMILCRIDCVVNRYSQMPSLRKMRTGRIPLLSFVVFLLLFYVHNASCHKKEANSKSGRKIAKKYGDVINGLNNFAFKFHNTLPKHQSVFYSSYGIASTLAMAFAGSGGKTKDEIATALGWEGHSQNEVHKAMANFLTRLSYRRSKRTGFQSANSIWVEKQEGLHKKYKELVRKYYGGKVGKLDFYTDPEGARKKINHWVNLKTRGGIKRLIPKRGISRDTRIVLSNAVYFKAMWRMPFDEKQTRLREFRTARSMVKSIPMMEGRFEIPILKDNSFTGVELPYKGGQFSMVVLLPTARTSLAAVEKELNYSRLENSYRGKSKVHVILPKFKMSVRYNLLGNLQSLGVKSLFNSDCDLRKVMRTGYELFVTDAIHNAFIEVNEKGTQASAATAIFLGRSLVPTFIANSPFVFFIKDNLAKAILFSGRFSPS